LEDIRKGHGQGSLFRIARFNDKIITFGHKNIFYSDDSGISWHKFVLESPLSYSECLYDYCRNTDGAWIAGIRGSLFHTTDGIKWEKVR
jgi:photosystem II stability/assembly factor-like uncharacterized protein